MLFSDRLQRGALAALLAMMATTAGAASADAPPAPTIRYQGDIAYVSGGVGQDEVAQMQALAPRFNVRLKLVSARGGEALSDVTVTVADANGKLRLRTVTVGPLLYLKLPRGTYHLHATYQGVGQTVSVTARRQAIDLLIRLPVSAHQEDWLLCKGSCASRTR